MAVIVNKERKRKTLCRNFLCIAAVITAGFVFSVLLSGCAAGSGKKEEQGVQADNEVAGFLFHFDQREETQKLVRLKNDGKLPEKVSWYFDPEVPVVSEAPSETEASETPEAEKKGAPRHEATASSMDRDRIIEIYNALNNVIIVGNMVNNGSGKGFYITFTLSDGSECTFDFPGEGQIRLSDHNYSIETDGTLWKSLRQD